MKSTIPVTIVLTLLLAACSPPGPIQTPIPTTHDPSPTLTPSPTTTPLPTPTNTPTPTNIPTRTPTPTLTPTPLGYHVQGAEAFALTYPDGWGPSDEDDWFELVNEGRSLFFHGSSEIVEQDTPEEDQATGLGESIDPIITPVAEDEIRLKDGTAAQRSIMKFKIKGKEYAVHQVRSRKGARAYSFIIYGPSPNVADNLDAIQGMFESIELRSETLYGLERERTLVLLGGDPYPEDLDPAKASGSASGYIGHLYSGLVRLSPSLQVEPDLAEGWTVSADGAVYTFTLRTDNAFQSGRAITAHDVVYSWERAADPETDSPTAATYLGDISGVREKLDGQAERIKGLQVIDDRTLVVRLERPIAYFLAKLTYPTSYIVDQDTIESDPEEWVFNPNASGPFVLRDFQEEEVIIFERNNGYHSTPAIEYIVYRLYQPGSTVSYFRAGEIDIARIGHTKAKPILDNPDDLLNDQLVSMTSMCTRYIGLNNTRQPMDDPEFRKALALSLDRERFNETFFENLAVPGKSMLPPGMPGFAAHREDATYDPKAAKAALESSSYAEDAPTIVINASGYGGSDSPYMDALIQAWSETLGIDMIVEYVDPRNSITELREADGHMVVSGWCADYPDPENFLDILFHSDSVFNNANYEDPEIDSLLEKARVEFDPTRRMALYEEIDTILLEDHAFIPMLHLVFYALVNPRIEGYSLTPMGAPYVHLLSIVDEP